MLRSRLGVTHIWWDCCFLIQGEQDVRLKSVRKTLIPSDPESPPGKQHTAYFVLIQFLCCARNEVQGSAQGRQMPTTELHLQLHAQDFTVLVSLCRRRCCSAHWGSGWSQASVSAPPRLTVTFSSMCKKVCS